MTDIEKLIDVFMHMGDHIRNLDEYGLCYDSTLAEAIEDVVEMLKNEEIRENQRKSEWIPVSEGFPDVGEAVLVCDTREDYVSCWEYYGGYWTKGDDVFPLNEVTHWMPLPEPPKEAEQ